MTTKIYVLCEPSNGAIRYVGKTSGNLTCRLSDHLSEARRGMRTHRCNWIRSVMATGKLPSIVEIGSKEGDGCAEERAWIAYGRAEGWNLANGTDGGDGLLGHKHSLETRRKMSKTHNISVEMRRKMSEARKNMSAETRRKISEALKGRRPSIETRKKLSEARKGKGHPQSDETRKKISEANTGKHRSVEARKKMSEARKRRICMAPVMRKTRAGRNANAWVAIQ